MRCGISHRWFLVWLLMATLYGGVTAMASEAVPARPPAGAATQAEPVTAIPHVALLLPVNSKRYARPAAAVNAGFLAAAKAQGWSPLPIRVYPVSGDPQNVITGYRQALAAGARVVVGPLTRDAVSALAASDVVAVPTLALNVPDDRSTMPPNLYTLSLQIEAEARQVARLAFKEGRRNAVTINGGTPLLRRMHQAFVDEFTHLGGRHVAEYAFTADVDGLERIRQAVGIGGADMAFLALDFRQAGLMRSYLDPLPLYATSQVNPGNAGPLAGFDLGNIRFVDMPWLVQPDHPAVMIYPRQDYHDEIDLDRLYALGIDAFRIAQNLLNNRPDTALDGVTGHITLGRNHHFMRELPVAQFSDGKLLVPGGSAQP
jgi:outer membrane PBP1 activator LpoA protein